MAPTLPFRPRAWLRPQPPKSRTTKTASRSLPTASSGANSLIWTTTHNACTTRVTAAPTRAPPLQVTRPMPRVARRTHQASPRRTLHRTRRLRHVICCGSATRAPVRSNFCMQSKRHRQEKFATPQLWLFLLRPNNNKSSTDTSERTATILLVLHLRTAVIMNKKSRLLKNVFPLTKMEMSREHP